MYILLTGGTGLIGRTLCRHWLAQGHQLTVWSRSPERMAQLCEGRMRDYGETPLDALTNLADQSLAAARCQRSL